MLRKALHFLREAHSEENGQASSRRLDFSLVVFGAVALLALDVIIHRGFRPESLSALDVILWTVGAYVGITRALKS